MWPAVDRDAEDVGRRFETAGTEHAAELIANMMLESLERGLEKFASTRAELLGCRQARFERYMVEVQYHRLVRGHRKAVVSEAHRVREHHRLEETAWAEGPLDAEFGQAPPVPYQYIRIDQRRADRGAERPGLLGCHVATNMRQHRMIRGEHDFAGRHCADSIAIHVGDVDVRVEFAVAVPDVDNGTVEPNSRLVDRVIQRRVVEHG